MQTSRHDGLRVFPTRVGVDLGENVFINTPHSFPHTRGGGPPWIGVVETILHVFPTRVGVDRKCRLALFVSVSFPHTRGGGPYA